MRRVLTMTVGGVVALGATMASAQPATFETVNVCQRLPVATVAAALGGRPIDERAVNIKGLTAARCVYGVELAGARRAFVIWINPAGARGLLNRHVARPRAVSLEP